MMKSFFKEKDKLLHRLHIYSWKHKQSRSKHSLSEDNLHFESKDNPLDVRPNILQELESKLLEFKNKMDTFNQTDTKPESRVNEEHEKEDDAFDNYSDSEAESSGSDAESEASTAIKASDESHENPENEVVSNGCDEDKSDDEDESEAEEEDENDGKAVSSDKNLSPSKRDVSLSPRERYPNADIPMTTEEKVNMWLPSASTRGREIQAKLELGSGFTLFFEFYRIPILV